MDDWEEKRSLLLIRLEEKRSLLLRRLEEKRSRLLRKEEMLSQSSRLALLWRLEEDPSSIMWRGRQGDDDGIARLVDVTDVRSAGGGRIFNNS